MYKRMAKNRKEAIDFAISIAQVKELDLTEIL